MSRDKHSQYISNPLVTSTGVLMQAVLHQELAGGAAIAKPNRFHRRRMAKAKKALK